MKIAVCFSGQIRTGVQTAPNIKRYIGDLESICDFFVHTWDHQSPPHVAHDLHPVNKSVFADFYRLYNPISMTVEAYDLARRSNSDWGGYRIDPKTGKKYISMFESIYKVNQLKIINEQASGFIYDFVVRIRPDLIFHPEKSLRTDISEVFAKTITSDNEFMIAYHKDRHVNLEDIFWIAKSPTMDKIVEFNQVRADSNKDIKDDWQSHMAAWVRDDLKLTFHGFQNSSIKLMRMSDAELDPLNYDSISPH